MAFARCVFLGSIVACAACGGRPGVDGKAFLLGQTDHSGTRVSVLQGKAVIAGALTDAAGAYRVEAPGGAYDLRFEHDGYQTAVQPDVVIGKNDVSVPETTLRRGALVAPAPIVSAQPLGSTKALVQFGDGIDSPSYILDLATGTTKQVAAGAVTVLDANDQFATVRVGGLHRLDLSTAALDPVDPPEGNPQRAFAAGGYYVYFGIDGKLNAVATGEAKPVSFDVSGCGGFFPSPGSASPDTPGWITVTGIQGCDSTFELKTLVNPSLHATSGAFSTMWVRARNAFLLEPISTAGSGNVAMLRKLDLVTGVETTLEDGVTGTNVSRDGNSLLLTMRTASPVRSNYAFVDLPTATVRDAAFGASLSQTFQTDGFFSAFLVGSNTGSTMIRIDNGTATPLCGGNAFPVFVAGRQLPIAVVCSSGATVLAYGWDTDSALTLSTSATSTALLFGRIVTWSEQVTTMRGARVGTGDAPVTLCSTRALLPSNTSAGGEAAALFCPDEAGNPRWIAVDMRTRVSQTILAPGSGVTVNTSALLLSSGGRGALLAYSTDAPAGDPSNCGLFNCIAVVDFQSGAASVRAVDQGGAFASVSPDDRGFLVNGAVSGQSLVVTFGAGAPGFSTIPSAGQIFGIGVTGRAAFLLSTGSFPFHPVIADLASGTTTNVSFYDTSVPLPIGSDGDFVVGEGIAHLDTASVQTLPAGWVPLCNRVGDPLLFLDPTRTILQEYGPGSGMRTVGQGLRTVQGSCFESFELLLSTDDGVRGTLWQYASGAGTVIKVAEDVSTKTSQSLLDHFIFQHPDLVSGDVLLVSRDGSTLRPLRARAHLLTEFIEGGKRVAFTGGAADGEPKLMVASLDGSGARVVGPAADRVTFSPEGAHLIFESRGLLWGENPVGPAVAFDELDRAGKVVISGSGQYLLYSVVTGDRRGTYRIDLGPTCTASAGSCTAPATVF